MNYDIWAGAGISAATFLVTWGTMRAKTVELERRVTQLENVCGGLHDSYVSYMHFNEFVTGVKENYRDLKNDIQRLFDAVSKSVSSKV